MRARDHTAAEDAPGAHPRWRFHGLSVQGYRHRRAEVPCQDAWGAAVVGAPEGQVVVLAVADGAGSRPYSAQGAQLAVELATHHFGRPEGAGYLPGEEAHTLLREGFREVRRDFLDRTGTRADDYATTLTVVVLTPAWLGQLSVGDGFAVVRAAGPGRPADFHLLPCPEPASEYGNETVFLTSPEAPRWTRTTCVVDRGIDGVLLSTDGLTQAALSRFDGGGTRTPNASFASSVLRALESPTLDPERDAEDLADLLRSDRLTALNADDKTLVRAVRHDRP